VAGNKDRERELARRRYQRQLERRAANQAKARQRMMIGSVVVAVLVIVGAVVGITLYGSNNKHASASAAGAGASDATAPATGAATAATAAPTTAASPTATPNDGLVCTTPPAKSATPQSYKSEPAVTIDTKVDYTATITTNCGVIKAELYASKAPHTVNSFVFLASKGYFNNTPCHRLTTSGIYVLQCGDPTGTGSGGPGYSFKDENLPGATYGAGVLAMANSGANTNGSQFFINYKDSTLNPAYTPFGKITQGLDIVQKIAARGAQAPDASTNTAPNQPVSILSFTITKGAPAPVSGGVATSVAVSPSSVVATSSVPTSAPSSTK
jgi:peptidyl-prolyl cis-trans isomerase B (cyclophilin B)